MTTTSALTCRTAADRSSGPGKDRTAPAGAAPTAIPRWTQEPPAGSGAGRSGGSRGPAPGRADTVPHAGRDPCVDLAGGSCKGAPGAVRRNRGHDRLQGRVGDLGLRTRSGTRVLAGAGLRGAHPAGPGPRRSSRWTAGRQPPACRGVRGAAQHRPGRRSRARRRASSWACHSATPQVAKRCACATGATSSTRTQPSGSPAITSPRSAIWSPTPEADPFDADLVGPDERRLQLEQLAGPERPRPQRRFHELFEERVRQHPERIAAVQDAREWTYAELNARANRIARALLARGLQAEDIVAVVAERDLEWMAAVIGIFKAGGAYLPIEPHFPADRIARTLTRAGSRVVLTEGGSTATLDEALDGMPAVTKLLFEDIEAEGHAADDLGMEVRPDQLAYVYFTSGSTGEPKGAMCEHDGMVNHLYAKIEDLGIGPGRRRRPERPPMLRHLAVATGLGPARRRPHTHRRAGPHPRRRAVRRHGGTGRGGGLPGRPVVSGRGGGVPGRQTPRPAAPPLRLGDRGGPET